MNTKEKILLAAVEEFSKNGYEGTTIRGICGKAEVNIAAVNYYFSSKAHLYEEVFNYLFEKTEKPYFNKVNLNITNAIEWHNEFNLFIRRTLQMFTTTEKHIKYLFILFSREEHNPSEHFYSIYKRLLEPRLEVLKTLLAHTDIKSLNELNIHVMNITFMLLGYAEKQAFSSHLTENENFITENIDMITMRIVNMVISQIKYTKLNKRSIKSDLY